MNRSDRRVWTASTERSGLTVGNACESAVRAPSPHHTTHTHSHTHTHVTVAQWISGRPSPTDRRPIIRRPTVGGGIPDRTGSAVSGISFPPTPNAETEIVEQPAVASDGGGSLGRRFSDAPDGTTISYPGSELLGGDDAGGSRPVRGTCAFVVLVPADGTFYYAEIALDSRSSVNAQ